MKLTKFLLLRNLKKQGGQMFQQSEIATPLIWTLQGLAEITDHTCKSVAIWSFTVLKEIQIFQNQKSLAQFVRRGLD